jgi:hypothetical protein
LIREQSRRSLYDAVYYKFIETHVTSFFTIRIVTHIGQFGTLDHRRLPANEEYSYGMGGALWDGAN